MKPDKTGTPNKCCGNCTRRKANKSCKYAFITEDWDWCSAWKKKEKK